MAADQFTITRHGGTQPTLRIAGTLDFTAVNNLIAQAIQVIHTLTIDAAAIAFCDAAGLGGLVSIYKSGRALGVPVRLANPSPPLIHLLTVAGLTHIFPTHDQDQPATG
jgi:anti-anti-sigma factor